MSFDIDKDKGKVHTECDHLKPYCMYWKTLNTAHAVHHVLMGMLPVCQYSFATNGSVLKGHSSVMAACCAN